MSEANLPKRQEIIQMIMDTPPAQIASLPFVKAKFIENYNACNRSPDGKPGTEGEMMYHRQQIHFVQIIMADDKTGAALRGCNPFSLYACFATAAANGYSLDPADNVVYMIPKGGKACLWRQAGAHVHRLIRTNQIRHAEQVQLVYQGDAFRVSKGAVLTHESNFAGEKIIAAYQEFVLPDGKSRYFIYQPSDWTAWRSKSDMPNGPNWNSGPLGQPDPGFLRTKITKHACMEKVWATGMNPIQVETFEDVEIESDALIVGAPVLSEIYSEKITAPDQKKSPEKEPAPAGIGSTMTTPRAQEKKTEEPDGDNEDF